MAKKQYDNDLLIKSFVKGMLERCIAGVEDDYPCGCMSVNAYGITQDYMQHIVVDNFKTDKLDYYVENMKTMQNTLKLFDGWIMKNHAERLIILETIKNNIKTLHLEEDINVFLDFLEECKNL